jgi:23S rRNA pseudouridine2604 synthase
LVLNSTQLEKTISSSQDQLKLKKKFRIILTQGLNRQIRRMCETLNYKVTALTRVRIMNFTLSNIAPGKWRYFTSDEITSLHELLKNSKKSVGDDAMGE